ncbi:hypothetical protein QL919_06125 [Psychrobacter sp. APC 3426]|uniref:hypothetical protein n=1 Tax=Psychrobacter sp. APC 3426 TaxID=3035177 RepID=UPI0025B2E335|nr:hypothetical protein [Psychrobacter sp. APC 3426]MDN3398303.1 hypothetical protein [Psychrobacter sp. APC 3426]
MFHSSQYASTLQALILQRIEQKSLTHAQIIQSMGYQTNIKTQARALTRLEHVLSSPELGLTKTGYDFKYSSTEFVRALCRVLDIEKDQYLPLSQQLEQYAHKVLNATMPIVYADVTFSDDFQPSFVSMMAVSKFRRIELDDEVRLFDRYQQRQVIDELVRTHYTAMSGNIPFDGIINGYRVSFENDDGQKEYLYIPTDFA